MNFINFISSNSSNQLTDVNNQQEGHVLSSFKRGDVIQIIRYKNSPYNMYKGYIGEVKDYKKGMDKISVYLYAMASYKLLILPLEHIHHFNISRSGLDIYNSK